jgi:DNA replicative helicase MCM subunit Mcm2 (Cdc46/Mcm family)
VRHSDIRKLIEIIKDLARKSPEGEAAKSEIIGEGELVGIPAQKIEELLQSLRKQGSIYESGSGKWRLSKK